MYLTALLVTIEHHQATALRQVALGNTSAARSAARAARTKLGRALTIAQEAIGILEVK